MIKKTINGAELATKYVRPSSKVITLAMGSACLLDSSLFDGSTNTGLEDDDDDPYFG